MENTQTNFSEFNQGVRPQNYMTLAIIATIVGCCGFSGLGFIVGLVGIYFASQVNPRFNAGDLAGAEKNSKYARIISFVAIGLFVLSLVVSAVVYMFFPEVHQEQMQAIQEMVEQMQAAQE